MYEVVREVYQSIQDGDIARMGPAVARWSADDAARRGLHWIGFHFLGHECLSDVPCVAHFSDGSIETGMLDDNNAVCWARPNKSACIRVEFFPPDVRGELSVADALLSRLVD